MNHWLARIQKLGRPEGHSDIGSPVRPASSVRRRRIRFLPTPTETEFARRVWSKALSDNVFGRAAELAYFFLFSLFPLLIVLTSLLGTVSGGAEIRGEFLRYLRTALPPTASRLVESTLAEISAAGGGGKLSLGILGAFVSAGAGMVAIIEGLNTAYNVREARPWLKRRAVALVLTLALSLFSLAALGIFLYGTQLGNFLANHVGVGATVQIRVAHPAVAARGDVCFCRSLAHIPFRSECAGTAMALDLPRRRGCFRFVAGGLGWSPALSQILRYLHGGLRIAGGGNDPDDLVLLVWSRHPDRRRGELRAGECRRTVR